MKITFYGAAREVTGSRHLIEVNGNKMLLDCGMFQGRRAEAEIKNANFPFDPKDILAVVLSHAHIDHSGSIPTLINQGFEGWVYTTRATADICSFMLRDSAYIQEREIEYVNKKLRKKGEPLKEPMYTVADAEKALSQFVAFGYEKEYPNIIPGVSLKFLNAGHILGSALVQLEIDDQETGKHHTLTFTGDLGRVGLPLLPDPAIVVKSDILVMESTYGDRLHDDIVDAEGAVARIVNETVKRGGKIIIPAFSLGRTQELIYSLHKLTLKGEIPEVPIYVDSPLAGNVTEVFKAHPECFDVETRKLFYQEHLDPFGFDKLIYTHSVDESKAINDYNGPAIIISASGMCEFGRILHHLKNNIEDPKNTFLGVGFMAKHTLGRRIVDGLERVNILGKSYQVKMKVEVLNSFSAHADKNDLIKFVRRIKNVGKVFLVHGEETQMEKLKESLEKEGVKDVIAPEPGITFEL